MIKHLRTTVAVLLALVLTGWSASAWALGLGQLQVHSQRDQPLLAEIPIISNDPTELEALQARLASPETFARIGLAPPQGIVSDLQFAVALDPNGRPVIRVTSAQPVQQPLLTFLVEVDWGQGRLVREYSALLDTPQTAAAPVQPPIDEATTTDNAVVRLQEPEPVTDPLTASTPTPVPLPPEQPAPAAGTPADTASDTATANVLSAPAPIPVPLPSDQTASPLETAAPIEVIEGETRLVRRGDTLGAIASSLGSGYNLDQTIVALLRANPEAFIDGNVNRLKAGAVLRIPDSESIARFSPDEAALVVREQTAQWRTSRRALPQPPAVVGATAGGARTEAVAPASSSPAAGGRRSAQARLEIVPPSASDARRAGTRSGVSAGGEGDMLRQQELQEAHETVAAREAEVEELKARVAELEKLQQQQQQLISMKDSELAAAQQRLATANQAQPAATRATVADFGPWIGIGAGLLVIGLLAFWWLNRKSRAEVPVAIPAEALRMSPEAVAGAFAHSAGGDEDGDVAFVSGDGGLPEEPAWNRLAKPAEAAPAPAPPAPASRSVPTWHAGGVEVGPLNPAPPGRNRIDLARAYLEMGDRETARSLLREVIARGDTLAVREEASRLLNELA